MTTSPSHSTTQIPSTSHPLPLPEGLSPDSIDTVPILASILLRLQNLSPTTNSSASAGSPPAASPSHVASGTGLLTIKDIPIATDDLKHKLQKARARARELPDMERSVKEQEEEIRELEERVKEQKMVLEKLRAIGEDFRRDRLEAGGMET